MGAARLTVAVVLAAWDGSAVRTAGAGVVAGAVLVPPGDAAAGAWIAGASGGEACEVDDGDPADLAGAWGTGSGAGGGEDSATGAFCGVGSAAALRDAALAAVALNQLNASRTSATGAPTRATA